MKHFTSISDIVKVSKLVEEVQIIKENPYQYKEIGKNKTLVLLFFNASLRTRISTEKAAKNLGMEVIVLNVSDAWKLEFEDGITMNLDTAEHIKEAAGVLSVYADIIGIRAFPSLTDKQKDEAEIVINGFKEFATVPILNLESATAHPLQALTDALTIEELKQKKKPKVVLSWAPHPRALPQAVVNSFIKIMQESEVEMLITHPKGYELNPEIVKNTKVLYNQEEALKKADFVYVKNWSSYHEYGKVVTTATNWMMTKEKLGTAKFMHCLPVRRNVVVNDAVLDSKQSVVLQQANNRTYAAQTVLKKLLENLS